MSEKLLPLDEWARQAYGEHAPSIHTLRRWARDGLIVPKPMKHGRTYFCATHARYVSKHSTLVRRILENGTAATQ